MLRNLLDENLIVEQMDLQPQSRPYRTDSSPESRSPEFRRYNQAEVAAMCKEDQPARDREQQGKPRAPAKHIGKEGYERGGSQRTQGGGAHQQRETDIDRGSHRRSRRVEPKQGAETRGKTLSSPKLKLKGPNVAGPWAGILRRRRGRS